MMSLAARLLIALAVLFSPLSPAAAAPGFTAGHVVDGTEAYPAAVIAADLAHGDTLLHQVWDMRRAPFGPRIALTPVASYGLSSGLAYDSTNKGLTISATKTVAGVDMTGNGLYIINTITATVSDIVLGDTLTGGYGVANGINIGAVNTGSPTTTVSYFTANFADMTQGHAGAIASSGGSITFDHGDVLTAARDPFTSGSVINATWTVWRGVGNQAVAGDHLEYLHWFGSGSGAISYSLFDASQIWTMGGGSGFFQIQSDVAPISGITFDHCIFYGAKLAVTHGIDGSPALGLPIFSLKAVSGRDVTITVSNSVVQKTLGGVYLIDTVSGSPLTGVNHIIDGGGNYDFDTGLPVNLTYH